MTVYIGYFSANESAHKHIRAVSDLTGDGENRAALRMPPPATADRAGGDGSGDRRDGAGASLQHDSALDYKGQGFSEGHNR